MKHLVVLIIMGLIVIILQPNLVFGHTIYPTPDEFYSDSDLIVLGRIISFGDEKQDRTYQIEVKEYVKKPDSFEELKTIDVVSCNPNPLDETSVVTGCQTYEIGQTVFFGLLEQSKEKLSIYSGLVVQNQNCTGKQLLQAVNPTISISVLQNEKSSQFLTGIKTDVVYDFVNSDLFAKNFTAKFQLNKINKQSKQTSFSETKQVLAPECVQHLLVSSSFIPKETGIYMASVTREDNSTLSFSGFSITDPNLPPLKQKKYGIPIEEIQCKEGFHFITRAENKPSCVKLETMPKLFERGIGFLVNNHPYSPNPDHN